MAFMSSFVRILQNKTASGSQGSEAPSKFRFVYLSGQMVETDQSKGLHLIPAARKIKVMISPRVSAWIFKDD